MTTKLDACDADAGAVRQERAEAFRRAEARLRLERLAPSGDAYYEAVKTRVITGEIGFDEAEAEFLAHYHQQKAAEGAR